MAKPLDARAGAPQLIDPPPGCPFAARCPRVIDVCRKEMPAVTHLDTDHWVRCHLAGTTSDTAAEQSAPADPVPLSS
jgi:peptide/nickel transport system ATP-binding protein